MILEIRLSNMFSIKDEIVLDMKSGGSKSKNASSLASNCFKYKDYELLKSVAIYGANASGKSNVIKAITACSILVLDSTNYNENKVFDFMPFKFDGFENKPSSFYIRFVHEGTEYEYSFTLTQTQIITESLYYYPNGRRAEVFTRDESKGGEKSEIYQFKNAIKRPLDVAINTSKKTLFVSRASQMDRDIAKSVYSFFYRQLMFSPMMPDALVESLFNDYKKELLTALSIADSDIIDVRIKKDNGLHFTTYHRNNPAIPFDLSSEESEGTKRLFYKMLVILDVLKHNKTLLWDEIDNSLHSKIVEYIFSLFHHSQGSQLICTTHDTNLLNLHKMRKDQIYFVNKRADGSSDLYSLFDYKDFRDTMDLEKAYLQGRFDAIPYIDDSMMKLKSLIENER